jgi:GNAT superfamily N-acetyltransferase
MTKSNVRVRKATRSDAQTVLRLVDALAEYEKLTPPDDAARTRLVNDLWGDRPRLEAFLAEADGDHFGYAFVLETYSSFLALPTLYLEDLFVLPQHRSKKAGYALFTAMVREAHRRGCGRMEWTVLDWNQLAIDFYKRFDATHMKEWHLYRLTKEDLDRLSDHLTPT